MSIAILCTGLIVVLLTVANLDFKGPKSAIELGSAVLSGLIGIALVLLAVLV